MRSIFSLPLVLGFAWLLVASTSVADRAAYYKDGEIHINKLGKPEGEPLTTGHFDFKPSWSQTDDFLVFFRRLENAPKVENWKTAICIIGVDGSGFHQLSDGTHTDFNQTWTRDGTNTPIWNRRVSGKLSYQIMASRIGAKPGDEIALTTPEHRAWAFTCLKDGRILVVANPNKQGRGYYLMTPGAEEKAPQFERIHCDLAKLGVLARITLSPDETKICFEFQPGFKKKVPGRVLYHGSFDRETLRIENLVAFANEERAPIWFAYPRWTTDGKRIMYHAGRKLFLHDPTAGTTTQVSTDGKADYRYPHGERAPK